MSTAYEFFQAIQENLIFVAGVYEKRAKPTFEATGYQQYYYAADETDEIGKTMVTATLDRSLMWNCSAVKGTNTCYEFIGLPRCADEKHWMATRKLPCPCCAFVCYNYNACTQRDIVGPVTEHTMNEIRTVECPNRLTAPLNNYVKSVLACWLPSFSSGMERVQRQLLKQV